MKYLVIIEKGPNNYSAYVPDLPGCTSAANSVEELLVAIKEAIEGHLEIMREFGDPIPEPTSESVIVEVPLAV
ncbi:MAG: type II toxin-antitoxin system HicB family antitoxin [FCB group bacterium]|jgi:predicted RNase H-like HicB family nuclease|nr:type II toxin-antitoxin system HicB family antitoxin [FCB group bacterium]